MTKIIKDLKEAILQIEYNARTGKDDYVYVDAMYFHIYESSFIPTTYDLEYKSAELREIFYFPKYVYLDITFTGPSIAKTIGIRVDKSKTSNYNIEDFTDLVLEKYGMYYTRRDSDIDSIDRNSYLLETKFDIDNKLKNSFEKVFDDFFKKNPYQIEKVIFSKPYTIVIFKDGSKTTVKCQKGEKYDEEKGLILCIIKKQLGNKSNFNNVLNNYIENACRPEKEK